MLTATGISFFVKVLSTKDTLPSTVFLLTGSENEMRISGWMELPEKRLFLTTVPSTDFHRTDKGVDSGLAVQLITVKTTIISRSVFWSVYDI
jgi:hypothetical protein